jgi:beta-phosphoglucomutase
MDNFSGKSTVIFDLDGLLIDSEPFWQKAYKAFLKKYNLRDDPEVEKLKHGAGVRDNIQMFQEKLGLKGDIDALKDEYRGFFYTFAFEEDALHLMPGAKHLLHCLSNNQYRLAIATGGHTEENIQEILTRLGIDSYFPTHISSDMVEKGKPDPAVYLKTAEILGVDPSDCVVLEDSVNGTKSAKAAGMVVIGVNNDMSYQNRLLKAGADLVTERLDDLIPIFAGGCCGGECHKD